MSNAVINKTSAITKDGTHLNSNDYSTSCTRSASKSHASDPLVTDGHKKTYEYISTKNILIHKDFQRGLEDRKGKLNKVVREWDADKAHIIQVALIEGKYFCYNGQLTMEAAKKVYGGDVTLYCEVIHGLSFSEMAKLFVEQDDNNTAVSRSDKIRVDANAGDPDAKLFKLLTERNGFSTDKAPYRDKGLICIKASTSIWNEFCESTSEQYEAILTAMRALDGDEYQCHNGIISGLGWFVREFDGKYDMARLIKVLQKKGGIKIAQEARNNSVEPRTGEKYGKVILATYNKGLRTSRLEVKR